jgi:large subunit ribosomal protein L15
MRLNELPKIVAFSKARKRKGKGVGSGNGKTAGRGHKGGKARSGYSPAPCCCGVPFYRHLPIRGFSNYRFRTEYEIVDLQKLIDLDLETVDKHVMADAGLIKHEDALVKVLGSADLKN